MKKRNNLKWWHHVLIFCGTPVCLAICLSLLIGLIKLIELLPQNHQVPISSVIFFLLLGVMGYFSVINDIRK